MPTASFIDVEVDDAGRAPTRSSPRSSTEVCPVDIFAPGDDGTLEIVEENLDECVALPLLHRRRARGRAVKVVKLYDDGAVLA